ncbi:hypothetical protein YC2023_078898 [Brassica napus]
MKQLPRLKYISLCNCRRLKALPELVQLETVKLSGCMNLESFIIGADGDCNNIQSISDQLGRFTKLSYVDLSSNDFETLPSSIRDLSSLRTLCLNKCKKLKSIEGFPLYIKYLYAHGSNCFCLKHEEHLITQFLTEGQNEEDSPRFACFPGTELPTYFDEIETGTSYKTGLPWPTPKLVGFDGCIVIALERGFRIQFSPLSYDYDWNYERYFHLYLQPDLFHFQDSSFHSIKSDHLVIIRGTKNISNLINKFGIQSNLQLSKEVRSPSAEIKACGFSLIWEDDVRDKIKTQKEEKTTSGFSSLLEFEKLKKTSTFFS